MTDQAKVKSLLMTMGGEHITISAIGKIKSKSYLIGLVHDLFEMVQTAYDAGRMEGLNSYSDYDKELEIFGYSEDYKEDRIPFTNEQAKTLHKHAKEFYEIQQEMEYEMYDEMNDENKNEYIENFIEEYGQEFLKRYNYWKSAQKQTNKNT